MTDANRATTGGSRYPTLKYTPPELPKIRSDKSNPYDASGRPKVQ